MTRTRLAAPVLATLLALTACGQDGAAGPSLSESGGSSVTTPSATPGPTGGSPTGGTPGSDPTVPLPPKPTAPPKSPTDPRPGGTVRTVSGTVSAGVEPNCVLLNGYLLVGGPRETLRPGARVTVTGRVQADLMTTCQQGIPFLVTDAKPA